MIYSVAGFVITAVFSSVYRNLISLYIDLPVCFFGSSSHIGYSRVLSRDPCAVAWVLVDYFINRSVYMLTSSCSCLPAHHLSLSITTGFSSESVRLCLFCEVHVYPLLGSTHEWCHRILVFPCLTTFT